MAASSNSWLHQNLLTQHNAQQQTSSHTLFHQSELPLHSSGSSHLGPMQHMDLGHGGHGMDSHLPFIHSSLHLQGDLQQPANEASPGIPGTSGRAGGGTENGDAASVRKVHKADREKLRRDRLNEQFGELAGVLDPDRPKNDKATILGDSVQVVKELRSEVKRLKCEQSALLDESRDLVQEKSELREEKAALKTEAEQLQIQLQQRLRGMLPWLSMDPSTSMMGAAPYPYPMTVPQPPTATPPGNPPSSEAPPSEAPQQPVAAPSPFLSIAPPGVYMHPYAMYGGRPPEGGHAYLPYPHYPTAVGNHSHIERPYAQYPSPLQAMPGYLVQMQAPQGGTNSQALPMYRPPPFPVPGMTLVPPGQPSGLPHTAFPQYPGMGPMYGPQASPSQSVSSPEPQGVETSLQLQTPGGPPRPPASESQTQRSAQSNGESKKLEGAVLELTPPGSAEVSDLGSKAEELHGSGDSIPTLTLSTSSSSQADPKPSSTGGTQASEEGQQASHGTHDSTLRPTDE